MATIKIVYVGASADEIRQGMNIPPIFNPDNSYVDSAPYEVGVEGVYGKSVYATNVDDHGSLPGLLPIASAPIRLAFYEKARIAAIEADANGTDNEGVTFTVADDAMETLYWEQLGINFVDQGYYTKVGDKEFGTAPASKDSGDEPSEP